MKSIVLIIFILSFAGNNCLGVPKIIIKLDDLTALNGICSGQATIEYLIRKQIKFSSGVIAKGLDNTSLKTLAPYILATDSLGENLLEIWHHGLDHNIPEFRDQTYAYQSQHLNDADQIVNKILNLQMNTFGTPGNTSDTITNRVIAENPNYHVFMLSTVVPTILKKETMYLNQRVEMENGTGNVNYDFFLKNYNKYKDKYTDYMIFQGHPNGWDSDKLKQFQQIIDFLIGQGTEFVLPYDYYCSQVLKLPLQLKAEVVTSNQVKLKWIDKNNVVKLYYKIERSEDSIVWRTVNTNSSNNKERPDTISYIDTNVKTKNGSCFYRVQPNIGLKAARSNIVKLSALDTGLIDISDQNKLKIQIFPNPCSESAIIKYQLSTSGIVTGRIYNLEGRLIKELFRESQFSGFIQTPINVSNMNSGIYFCRIVTPNDILTQKIIIAKL
jgi:hypothetical protein